MDDSQELARLTMDNTSSKELYLRQMMQESTKLPNIISPDTNFSSLDKLNEANSRNMEDYLNDDVGTNPPSQINYKECSLDNPAPQMFTMWADHHTRDMMNPLSNRQTDNNSLIKPYLNGVYEKSDIQIQSIMQRHRISSHMRNKTQKQRKEKPLAMVNSHFDELMFVPRHEVDFLEMRDQMMREHVVKNVQKQKNDQFNSLKIAGQPQQYGGSS
jgi:hypothetical protein